MSLVFVSGSFNVLHPGHLRLLRFARECGDRLIVAVQSDRLAGNAAHVHEPIRLEGVQSITCVYEAFIFDEPLTLLISCLRPLTSTTPKCLVPIKGQPLLDIWLERLTQASIGPFLINTYYLAKQVVAFIEASPYRDQVTLVNELELQGTAGTLIANLDFFQGEDGLLIHADNYCLADFIAFQHAHRNRPPECQITMMTFRADHPSSCGIVELDDCGVVIGFHEKVANPPGNLANGAVYILSADLLNRLATDLHTVKDFSTEVLNRFIGRIYSYETSEVFLDVGTPETYEQANN
jgi:mannose-1-phosphate guanylyltransferase